MRQINNCFTNDKITDKSIDIYKLNDPKIYIYIYKRNFNQSCKKL